MTAYWDLLEVAETAVGDQPALADLEREVATADLEEEERADLFQRIGRYRVDAFAQSAGLSARTPPP